MDIQVLLIFILLTLIAEILGTIGGFGSSVFFVPIAGYFFDFYSVLGITVLFHIISNLSKIALFRDGFDRKIILTVGIPSVLLVIVGAYFSKFIDTELLKLILAGFLIVLSLIFILMKHLVIKPTLLNALTGGSLSGLLAGLVGTGGAIRGLTLAAFNLEKSVFVATSAMIDLGVDFSRSVVYAYHGYIQTDDLYLVPFLVVAAIAGTWIGKKILTKIPQQKFRIVVLTCILVVGIFTLYESIYSSNSPTLQ